MLEPGPSIGLQCFLLIELSTVLKSNRGRSELRIHYLLISVALYNIVRCIMSIVVQHLLHKA
jgi:hypothetical protein